MQSFIVNGIDVIVGEALMWLATVAIVMWMDWRVASVSLAPMFIVYFLLRRFNVRHLTLPREVVLPINHACSCGRGSASGARWRNTSSKRRLHWSRRWVCESIFAFTSMMACVKNAETADKIDKCLR